MSTDNLRSKSSLAAIELLDDLADGASVVGCTTAAGADDVGAGGECIGDILRHVGGELFVDRFHVFENGKSGVGLNHCWQTAAFPVNFGNHRRAVHVHARAAV